MRTTLCALALIGLLTSSASRGSSITRIYVFGDDLSDQGNAYARMGGQFPPQTYFQGRASNGPVAVEYLASRLGIPLQAPGGTNHAVMGAFTGNDNLFPLTYPQMAPLAGTGILAQVAAFASSGAVFDPDATLFVVWGGREDFLYGQPSATTVTNAVSNLASAIGTLKQLGAERFLVPNLPDLSLTPAGRALDPAQQSALHALTVAFNAGLQQALGVLFPATVVGFDAYGALNAITANPAAYGLVNVTDRCLTGTTPCATPSTYMYWDSVNPTTAMHDLLARGMAAKLAQPGDVDANGSVNVTDVLYLINHLFAGGPAPVGNADVDGSGGVNVSDVLFLINHLFAGGPAPA